MRPLIALVLSLTVVACGGAPAKQPPPPPPREVQVLTMAPSEARVQGEYLGALLSRASLTVLPQVAGYVRKIHVKPGQPVAIGDPLVEIDAREESAALSSAAAQADSAGAALALAEQSRARIEALHQEGLATAQELDKSRADVAAATAAVRAAGAQVSQRRVAVGNRVVRAAVPGVIGDVVVRIGDYVTATSRLTTIAGSDGLELTLAVPAPRARTLAVGAPIEVLDDDGQVLHATTAFYVAAEADPRTQLVAVKAAVPSTLGLRPSELVRARVVYAVGQALQVPALAVVRQGGAAFVFVVTDQPPKPKPGAPAPPPAKPGTLYVARQMIQLGALGAKGFVVEHGLTAGDRVAVSSIQLLRDGAAVAIAAPKAAPTPGAAPPPPAPAAGATPPSAVPPAGPPAGK
ncbi:MAG: efflux RND transporter periplasmic adaptor subunit [Myxococcales bacterium]|nr:efflux RND transporter periplasmic adaptor subunit [Myxococcales bacterium]